MLKQKGLAITKFLTEYGFIPLILLIPLLLISGIVISGAFYLKNYSPVIKLPATYLPVPSIKPKVSPSPIADATADWKTYTAPSGSYSFRYPNVLIQDMSDSGPKYGPNTISVGTSQDIQSDEVFQKAFYLTIHYEKNTSNSTLDQIQKNLQGIKINIKENSFYGATGIKPYSNGEINGLLYEEDYDNGDQSSEEVKIISLHNGYKYIFSYSNLGQLAAPGGEKIVQQILSTFKFLPASPAGWDQN